MQDLYKVIEKPVVTEKSVRAMEEDNVYTFLVNPKANKVEIAGAIEKLWDVTVQEVRTMKYQGKMKRATPTERPKPLLASISTISAQNS